MARYLQDEILNVLRGCTSRDGWMKRSDIVKKVYGKDTDVNAHHRTLLTRLTAAGVIEERDSNNGFLHYLEYRAAR